MRIAVDAMGGDYAPGAVVAGAIDAARRLGLDIALTGPPAEIASLLEREAPLPRGVEAVAAPDIVGMDEHPADVVRRKPRSSIAVGLDLVKSREADAFVSAGNTGAVMAYAVLRLGRVSGVERPALGAVFPSAQGPVLVLDVGANADSRPSYLVQFAQMGVAYAERVLGVPAPRVGLLNIGEEEAKGSQLAQEAHRLLAASGLPFAGNVEGTDIPRGAVSVVVTDGFTGNVALKVAEGVSEFITGALRQEITSRPHYRLAALLLRPAFRALRQRLDYAEYGGAPLLGVNGVVIVAHGRSDARAIFSAIRAARDAVQGGLVDAIRDAAGRGRRGT